MSTKPPAAFTCAAAYLRGEFNIILRASNSSLMSLSEFCSETKRKYIEDICMDNTTLIDTRVCQFWSPMLVKLLVSV